jgi:lysophospholipase L1-like esterase
MRRERGGGLLRFAAPATVFAVLLTILAGPAPAAPPEDGPQLSFTGGLSTFFAALERLEKQRSGAPLRILQIGDSHTANDAFSGRLRESLQARFGAAGRGWVPGGVPFKYYRPRLVSVAESGWRHFGPGEAPADLPLGIDANAAQSERDGASMMLASTEPAGFDRSAIEFVARPGGGTLRIRVDRGRAFALSTAAPSTRIKRYAVKLRGTAHEIALGTEGSRPVVLLGWSSERRRPGIIYENHGTIGATVRLLTEMTPAAVSFELQDRQPALLIVAFGTNEGFASTLDLGQYAASFRAAVAALHREAKGADILVLGPPDGNRRDKACTGSEGAGACLADNATAASDPCAWREPRNLAAVREIQKQISREQGWAFWDWNAAMGGVCSMDRLAARNPPFATPDHVHFTEAGYTAAADRLYADLISEYDKWKRSRIVRH